MILDRARRLLDRIGLLRNPCDLDVLVFFARHPLSLLASEQLAILLGYDSTQIAASVGLLQRAGVLIVSEDPAFVARKYVFSADERARRLRRRETPSGEPRQQQHTRGDHPPRKAQLRSRDTRARVVLTPHAS
jgi:hypothetical protein